MTRAGGDEEREVSGTKFVEGNLEKEKLVSFLPVNQEFTLID